MRSFYMLFLGSVKLQFFKSNSNTRCYWETGKPEKSCVFSRQLYVSEQHASLTAASGQMHAISSAKVHMQFLVFMQTASI